MTRPNTTPPTSSTAPASTASGRLPPWAAAALASASWLVPWLLSRSTAPTPDHPRVLLWYKTLRQPTWKPPDVAIPIVWAGLETLLATAAYRLLRRRSSPARNRSLAWLFGNVVSIGAWSRLFFGQRNLPAATAASAALAAGAAAYVDSARRTDRTAAAAGVPLVAWVAFATVLTAAIWRKNRRH